MRQIDVQNSGICCRLVNDPQQKGPNMSRKTINTLCAAYPGATAADPTTELDSWKVGGKMFACFAADKSGVCVKTDSPETAAMLIDAEAARKAPYFHKSWVLVSFDADTEELKHRVATSYAIIAKTLPKKVRDSLGDA